MMQAAKPHNTYWAVPGALLAGEYPGDQEPAQARQKLTALLDCGVRAFLDLTETRELRPYDRVLRELAQARGLDCVHRRMPIPDMGIPNQPQAMQQSPQTHKQRCFVRDWRPTTTTPA